MTVCLEFFSGFWVGGREGKPGKGKGRKREGGSFIQCPGKLSPNDATNYDSSSLGPLPSVRDEPHHGWAVESRAPMTSTYRSTSPKEVSICWVFLLGFSAGYSAAAAAAAAAVSSLYHSSLIKCIHFPASSARSGPLDPFTAAILYLLSQQTIKNTPSPSVYPIELVKSKYQV